MLFALPTPAFASTRPAVPAAAIVRVPGLGVFLPRYGAFGTALRTAFRTVVRSGFHGWLSGRTLSVFQAERREPIGTVLLSPIHPRPRAGFHGWFAARGAASVFFRGFRASGGAAARRDRRPGGRPGFPGWFAEQRSERSAAERHYHVPVLADEACEWMAAGAGRFIIDGTLGGGGHSERFLEAGASVLGIDRDPEALAHARERLARFGDRFHSREGNFAEILLTHPEVLGGVRADGLLLDLGVSSRQLDAAERGFSFQKDGPLDMRMGPSVERTAAEVVNEWPESELLRVLREYGEEPQARRIAAAIVRHRAGRPFESTLELAGCIEREIGRRGRTHPATRSFQAIRIAVNDELGSLQRALERSVEVLRPGGRLLVITFHSLEDRMVKQFMQDRSRPWLDRPEWPEPRPNPRWAFRLPRRKAIAPGDAEIRTNPRARSAKLRVAELLNPDTPRP